MKLVAKRHEGRLVSVKGFDPSCNEDWVYTGFVNSVEDGQFFIEFSDGREGVCNQEEKWELVRLWPEWVTRELVEQLDIEEDESVPAAYAFEAFDSIARQVTCVFDREV